MVVMLIFFKGNTFSMPPKWLFISYAMWHSASWRRNRQPEYQNNTEANLLLCQFFEIWKLVHEHTHMCVKLAFVGIISFSFSWLFFVSFLLYLFFLSLSFVPWWLCRLFYFCLFRCSLTKYFLAIICLLNVFYVERYRSVMPPNC